MSSRQAPEVDVVEAHRRASQPGAEATLLIDVREPHEFQRLRAQGAALFPLSTFVARLGELPRDRPIEIICQTGFRSGNATAYLLANGWTDVVNVVGGTDAWASAGLPVNAGPLEPGEGDLPSY